MEKKETSCTFNGNVNWYSHYGEQYVDFFKKLGRDLLYDSITPLLGIDIDKIITERDLCTPMFIKTLQMLGHVSNLDVHW